MDWQKPLVLFNHNELKNVYRTDEISFDPVMISEFYREKINNNNRIEQKLNTYVSSAYKNNNEWYITLITLGKEKVLIKTPSVINATYSGLNAVNDIFDGDKLDLIHEISEIALIHSDKLKNIGLTVMDGSFCSTMPYGLSKLNSLSSVRYTHHVRAKGNSPEFDCQKLFDKCDSNHLYNCNVCIRLTVIKSPMNQSRNLCQQLCTHFRSLLKYNRYQNK